MGSLKEFQGLTKQGRNLGIFNPRQWATEKGLGLGTEKAALQKKIKTMLLQWVYPGLKDAKKDEITPYG